jgi:ABC-2 type transport system ATP-binding protein
MIPRADLMSFAIHTQNLSKHYGRTVALSDLTLAVPRGAIYALVGANGAGKTTLIKLLMNIFRPTAGQAQVLGIHSNALAGAAFNCIGYVSENQELPEWMTVAAMLDYLRPFYPGWDRSLEQQLVAQFDLPLTRRLRHLSRGMRMKAAFAAALAYRPSLIVLDEPFSGLDPLVRDELIEGLLDRAPETTIFLSSHDLAEIESFASHIGYLEQGRLLFSEEMSTLADRFREVSITLASPSPMPTNPPRAWLQLESADSVVRFVHSEFQPDTAQELAGRFPSARDISINPMPLRSIFLAIARSGRATVKTSPESAHNRTEA